MEAANVQRLSQMEEQCRRLQSENNSFLQQIESLRASVLSKDMESTEMAQEQRAQRHQLESLQRRNADLSAELKAAAIAHEEASILNAKNQMLAKEHRQVQEEQFRLRMREQQQLNEEEIGVLRSEMSRKQEDHQRNVNGLMSKMDEMERNHKAENARLRDEYMSRIRHHRDQMQNYVNSSLRSRSQSVPHHAVQSNGHGPYGYHNQLDAHSPMTDNKRRESLNDDAKEEEEVNMVTSPLSVDEKRPQRERGDAVAVHDEVKSHEESSNESSIAPKSSMYTSTATVSSVSPINKGTVAGGFGHSISISHSANSYESQASTSHSRDESVYSQMSNQSADEIVTSLVIGIDEKLDDILAPTRHSGHSLKFDPYDQDGIRLSPHQIGHKSAITPYSVPTVLESPPPQPTDSGHSNGHNVSAAVSNGHSVSFETDSGHSNSHNTTTPPSVSRSRRTHAPRSNMSLLLSKPMMAMLDVDDTDSAHRELSDKLKEYEARVVEYEEDIHGLQKSCHEMVRKHEDQETLIQSLKEKNRKWKRKQFDWDIKEKEYKSLLRQYSEIRESNAKLTLTYWTLQCQYDKLKRDYDKSSSMVMQYGDLQINLTNQMMMTQLEESSTHSSNRNLLLSNHNSNSLHSDIISSNNIGDQFQFPVSSHPPSHDHHNGMDILSDEEDEVDMVVGFMSSSAQRSSQVMQVNDVQISASSPTSATSTAAGSRAGSNLNVLQGHSSNASNLSHGYNMSFVGHQQMAFHLSGKTKDELVDEVLKLNDRIDEINEKKLRMMQSSQEEIARLEARLAIMKEEAARNSRNGKGHGDDGRHIGIEDMKEIQLDQELSKSDNVHKKSRASFGGGIIGFELMSNEDHTHNVSKNDLDTVAKQLMNPHTRAHSMAILKHTPQHQQHPPNARAQPQSQRNQHRNVEVERKEVSPSPDAHGRGHEQQLTFLDNISEQTEDVDIDHVADHGLEDGHDQPPDGGGRLQIEVDGD